MTRTITLALQQTLQRHGDDLYRLALLLTPDPQHAAAALVAAARRLSAESPGILDESALLTALVAALPPERPRRRPPPLPAWAQAATAHVTDVPLLAAIARLQRNQRLALGLLMLHADDTARFTALPGCDREQTDQLISAALRAVAPAAGVELPPPEEVDAPAGCLPTRAALARGSTDPLNDPALRGHVALCPDCRAIAQAWQHLHAAVDSALRAALLDECMPHALRSQMVAALTQPPQAGPSVLRDLRGRRALVPLIIIGLIILLVLPRPDSQLPPAARRTGAASAPPRALVERALATLYALPAGKGTWHGRWEIYARLLDGADAPLVGEIWREPSSGRQRVQLVHRDGGGPYEFILADGDAAAWYAVTERYGATLYPLLFQKERSRTHLQLDADAQKRLVAARLDAGAWGLAGAYLRQAQVAPDLRSWGSQRAADGMPLEIIGFRGYSALGLPPDAPGSRAGQTTVLLTIEPERGTLREVREVVEPEGGEQVGRTVWRFAGDEWLDVPTVAGRRIFDLERAWNGIGQFSAPASAADPALPTVGAERLRSPAQALTNGSWIWLPARAPAGAQSAVLLDSAPETWPTASTVVYPGRGRYLAFRTQLRYNPPRSQSDSAVERITLSDQEFTLRPGYAQTYTASVVNPSFTPELYVVTEISAQGYTRAALIEILRTFGRMTIEGYRAQARLFVDPLPRDPLVFETLLNALALPQLPAGDALHRVERVYSRQDPHMRVLPDPYHLPRYGGRPEQLMRDVWIRGDLTGDRFQATEISTDARGAVYDQRYIDRSITWSYDGPTDQVSRFYTSTPTVMDIMPELSKVLQLLACGQARLEVLPDSTKVIMSTNADWYRSDSCQEPAYSYWLTEQQRNPDADGPYLLDVAEQPITSLIYLDAGGRPIRTEVRSGATRDGMLLEWWELVETEQVPAERIPAEAVNPVPPEAQLDVDYTRPFSVSPPLQTVPLTQAARLAQTPLFYLPPDDNLTLPHVAVNSPNNQPLWDIDDVFEKGLLRGIAIRFSYRSRGGGPFVRIYQGPADRFGAFLRANAHWRASEPIQVVITGQMRQGWKITQQNGTDWALVEVDGTLLAVEAPAPVRDALMTQLQRLAPSP